MGCCDGARWGGRGVGVARGGREEEVVCLGLGWVGAEEGQVARLLPGRSLVAEDGVGIACGCFPVALEGLSLSLMPSLAYV